ncbi:IS200/IS605 family accessory protein TnpB-related protein [Microcoleus sp. Z1_A1]|uniref:IS200/IS605 family accessory protein TnpB-related protein n=2 Tax=Microcoleus TaxID=44471 RepID=UPI002FD1D7AA
MATITYCKGLPTPADELNEIGFTDFEMFLEAYAPIFRAASIETVNHLLLNAEFKKSEWNTHLQQTYGINKRHANGVISSAKGRVDAGKEHRILHIKTLEGKIKSLSVWLKKAERKLVLARKFYAKKKWHNSKTGCNFPIACSLDNKSTNWQNVRFQIHNKKRRLTLLTNRLEYLKTKPFKVFVPYGDIFVVGSKDESFGNQVSQWNGNKITFRVPKCLESRFGKTVSSEVGDFNRKINRQPECGAKTWHFYRKNGKWVIAVQFTPNPVNQVSRSRMYGCIGIDMNPGSIGWAYVDLQGNLKAKGQIPLQMGLPNGKQQAQIVKVCLQLAAKAAEFECPVVCEELDFSTKKESLGEKGRKYSRMLSSWAYSEFYKQLNPILSNRGVELITVNPAYSSIIGLVKYLRMYGLASDESAALVIARRAMRLSEKIPRSLTAYSEVNSEKHVWSEWNQLNKKIKRSGVISRRCDYYTVSNWSFLVNLDVEEA